MDPHDPEQDDAIANDAALEMFNGAPDGAEYETGGARRPWRPELARWLLSLNPGRTQDEYAKAARYFFETPGVPQDLEAVSPDLLLAYRGALTLRAERTITRADRRARTTAGAQYARLWGRAYAADAIAGEAPQGAPPPPRYTPGPLAPATVNLRLTALRQFLRFAALREPLPGLTPDQVHAALKRLPIERRRPYQILDEDEWAAFLSTARQPLGAQPKPMEAPSTGVEEDSPVVWGHTRTERERAAATHRACGGEESEPQKTVNPLRARDGRTGALTALRDYALVTLALSTGLRAIELSLLDVGDLSHERRRGSDEWWLILPDAKTKGQRGGRTLPLAVEVMTALREYIESTGRALTSQSDRATPLFLALLRGPHGDHERSVAALARLRPEQIRSVINRIETQWVAQQRDGSTTGQPGEEGRRISPHALRHSAAIALLKGSEETGRPPASVEHVRGWLGHFDIRTTQRYLDHLNSREERRRFVIAPLSPNRPDGPENADGSGETQADGALDGE